VYDVPRARARKQLADISDWHFSLFGGAERVNLYPSAFLWIAAQTLPGRLLRVLTASGLRDEFNPSGSTSARRRSTRDLAPSAGSNRLRLARFVFRPAISHFLTNARKPGSFNPCAISATQSSRRSSKPNLLLPWS
jgi:hypothetical protein